MATRKEITTELKGETNNFEMSQVIKMKGETTTGEAKKYLAHGNEMSAIMADSMLGAEEVSGADAVQSSTKEKEVKLEIKAKKSKEHVEKLASGQETPVEIAVCTKGENTGPDALQNGPIGGQEEETVVSDTDTDRNETGTRETGEVSPAPGGKRVTFSEGCEDKHSSAFQRDTKEGEQTKGAKILAGMENAPRLTTPHEQDVEEGKAPKRFGKGQRLYLQSGKKSQNTATAVQSDTEKHAEMWNWDGKIIIGLQKERKLQEDLQRDLEFENLLETTCAKSAAEYEAKDLMVGCTQGTQESPIQYRDAMDNANANGAHAFEANAVSRPETSQCDRCRFESGILA